MAILDEQLELLPKGSLIKLIKDINNDYEKFSGDEIVEEIKVHNQIKHARLRLLVLNELNYQAKKEEQ
jgi:hypothetical protein